MNDPLHILMVTHHRQFKIRFRSHAMAKHLVERGHFVREICIADTRRNEIVETDWDGVQVVETPDLLWGKLRSGWDPWDILNRIQYLNRDKTPYDLIHCFETRPVTIYPAKWYQRNHDIPLITDWVDWWGRGGIIDELRPLWYRKLFGPVETYYEEAFRASASGLTVISTALAERAIKLGVNPDHICHIPGGVFPREMPSHPLEECRDHVGLPQGIPIIGFASLDSYLDLEFMMAAFKLVVEKYPDAKLLITGKAGDTVRELASKHGVADNLHLTGFVPFEDLTWHLGSSNVFVLPFPDKIYNRGRWPNKVGDYMCIGRPIVTNPVGDIKKLFENNQIGLLAGWTAEDFAAKINYLLEHKDEAARFGENARQLANTTYDWRTLVGKLEIYYRKVLSEHQAEH